MDAYVIGSGVFAPEREVANEEIAERLGLAPEQIFKFSGIRRRRWAEGGVTTSSLASAALKAALVDAGRSAEEVDYVLFGTMTPDRFIPGSAPVVQHLLGLPSVPALDIRATCCNTLYGLQLSSALIRSGATRCVALCLAEVQSPWLDLSAESGTLSMLFGDGASALVVSDEPGEGSWKILDVLLGTDGSYADDLGVRSPGTEFGLTGEPADSRPRMTGQSVILQASRRMTAACRSVLERNNLTGGDVRWLTPHQANANLLAQVARSLSFPAEGIVSVLEEYGNTSSAAMGMAIDALRRSGRTSLGDYVLMPAFGAGFTWGAGLCRVTSKGA